MAVARIPGITAAMLMFVASCIDASTVTCPDGSVCPSGSVCAVVMTADSSPQRFCVAPDRVGCGDETCDINGQPGACHDGVCFAIECGNQLLDPGEVCDDGNNTSGDGCSADCSSDEICGSGKVDTSTSEECDAGVPDLSNDGCTSRCKLEGFAWRDVSPVATTPRIGLVMAYDSERKRNVAFGGATEGLMIDETSEWDGERWVRRPTARTPLPRQFAAMAYDAARRRIVLFGGIGEDYAYRADTWEWDGTTWTELHPTLAPPARAFTALAYDAQRARVVLYGGLSSTGSLGDTWEWDGTTWIARTPPTSPPARANHVMAFDPRSSRRVVVMYGNNETWEWDGTTWAQPTISTTSPTAGKYMGMAYDEVAQEVVVTGVVGNAYPDETWGWDGADWHLRASSLLPPKRVFFGFAAFDPATARAVLFAGGTYGQSPLNDTWLWRGAWSESLSQRPSPPERTRHALAYDARHGLTVLFGGEPVIGTCTLFADTWAFDQTGWAEVTSTSPPTARSGHGMAYDGARDRVVMFGGGFSCGTGITNETWEWSTDARKWVDVTPGLRPPARRSMQIAYDERNQRVVVFGGQGASGSLGDTWTWNGTTWTAVTGGTSPPARAQGMMAFDSARGRIVLFGGATTDALYTVTAVHADTWEWDGAAWSQRTPAVSPEPRTDAAMTYDPQRRRVVLFGGQGGSKHEIWEWDGATWTPSTPDGSPGNREGFVYDHRLQRIVAFGGSGVSNATDDTWALEYRSPLQPTELCVRSQDDDDGDGLAGCADPDCWGRCTPLCPPGLSCASGLPRCGDASCGPVEDRSICPADCVL